MTLTVQLFAAARDLAGSPTVTIELPAGAAIAELRRALAHAHPALANLLSRCRIAVDHDFVEDTAILVPTAEVAVIPPVSGG
jgi:molybdopterin converting factor subunit 1